MLIFIGLGLNDDGISLRGLREAKNADTVYMELYTSYIPGFDRDKLEQEIGKPIQLVDRKKVEIFPDEILNNAKTQKVAFLVPGDPMIATTHVDLRLRAAKSNIETKLIHAASIISSAAGAAGLQSYKFGPSATIPFSDNPSIRPYEVLEENLSRGLHTLLLLDIRAEEKRLMSANEGIKVMLALEERLRKNIFTPNTLGVVVARVGTHDNLVVANTVEKLIKTNFGSPPHALIIPGKLHFMESEALRVFAGAPEEALK
ncbi:MAG: diphthine synthase [Hadesarchaea archaeon]|nr:MAG: diphthine synthase [Hadesarchaea archaeon]